MTPALMLFVLALQAASITVVFVRGSLFERVRSRGPKLWQELSNCALCAGVWIGFGWHLLSRLRALGDFGALRAELISGAALDMLATGAISGTLALAIALLLDRLDGDDDVAGAPPSEK